MNSVVISVVVGALSSGLLKYAPAAWKGKLMAGIAFGLALVVAVLQVYLAGHAPVNWSSASTFLEVLAGQQAAYALFKDDLKL